MRRAAGAATLLSLAATGPASAHAPVAGLGSFYQGLIHPFVVPSHVLLLVAASLFVAQASPETARRAMAVLILAFVLGVATTVWLVNPPSAQTPVLGLAVLCGLMTALDHSWLRLGAVPVVAAAGAALGFDSGADDGLFQARLLMSLGTCLGFALGAIAICGLAVEPAPQWKKIGRRIVGSWTAAAAMLVLALSLPRS